MGMRKKPSTSESNSPNPKNFLIVKAEPIGDYWLLLVKYPGCTNFEGKKILVWEGILPFELDTHFNKQSGLLARFRPDAWKIAEKFVRSL